MPFQRTDQKLRFGHQQPQDMPSILGLNSDASQGTAMKPADPTSSVPPPDNRHDNGDVQSLRHSTADVQGVRRSPSLVVECGTGDRSDASQRAAMKPTEPNSSVPPSKSRHESGDTLSLQRPAAAFRRLRRSRSLVVECGCPEPPPANTRSTSTAPTPPLPALPSRSDSESPYQFRPGVTAEGYVLSPYLCSPHALADEFDFREGDILSVPISTPSMHPNTIATFKMRPVETPQGPLYITSRLMVVIKLYNNTMRCLPIFFFGLAGLSAVSPEEWRDYVGVKPEGEGEGPVKAESLGDIRRIRFDCFGTKTMHPASLVHLLGEVQVPYSNEIVDIGRVPRESFEELMVVYYARQSSTE